MPTPFFVDEFTGKIDSLYRLVIVASRRANQISKNEYRGHGFGFTVSSKKPTVMAVDEVLSGKLGYTTDEAVENDYLD